MGTSSCRAHARRATQRSRQQPLQLLDLLVLSHGRAEDGAVSSCSAICCTLNSCWSRCWLSWFVVLSAPLGEAASSWWVGAAGAQPA